MGQFALTANVPGTQELSLSDGGSIDAQAIPVSSLVEGVGPTFVYNAAATPGGNVYNNWNAMMVPVEALPGPKWIMVIGSQNVPARATPYVLDGVTFVGEEVGTLTFADGALINSATTKNFRCRAMGMLMAGGSATSVFTIADALINISLEQGTLVRGSSATACFFHWTAPGEFGAMIVTTSSLGADALLTDVATPMEVELVAGSTAGANAFQGSTGPTAIFDASSTVNATQGAAPSLTRLDLAPGVAFTATTPGNWNPAPTTVQNGLDQLAAPNFVQAASGVVGASATITVTTGNIAKKRSGKVRVTGCGNVLGNATTPIEFQILRDATPISVAQTIQCQGAGQGVGATLSFIDTLPDTANHTYSILVTPGASTVSTVTAAQTTIDAQEL